MNTPRIYLPIVCVVASFLSIAGMTDGAEFFGLGQLPDAEGIHLFDMSSDGRVVVGYASGFGDQAAWRWTAQTGLTYLAEGLGDASEKYVALGVSGDGLTSVGTKHIGSTSEAYRWTEEHGFTNLTLLPDSMNSAAADISEVGGTVVGAIYIPTSEPIPPSNDFRRVPCFWTADGRIVSLGVHEGFANSFAQYVSADGSVIAGRSMEPQPDLTSINGAWIWTEDTGYIDLGQAIITDISSDGSVVVGFNTPSPDYFRWTADTGKEILDVEWSVSPQVSRDGALLFGNGSEGWPGNATIWDSAQGDRDLRDLLISDFDLATELRGWQLHLLMDNSQDNLTIVGSGTNPAGEKETWMAILDPPPKAGDANQDFDFDQLDLVQVQVSAKYLTGEPATWGEGDWNGTSVMFSTDPPVGDGVFNQLDIVAAQQAGLYLTGSYAGQSGGFVALPEPTGLALAVLGVLVLVLRRYRSGTIG